MWLNVVRVSGFTLDWGTWLNNTTHINEITVETYGVYPSNYIKDKYSKPL